MGFSLWGWNIGGFSLEGEETELDAAYVYDHPTSPLQGEGRVRGHREAVQGTGRWTSTVRIAGEAPFTLLPPVQGEGPT